MHFRPFGESRARVSGGRSGATHTSTITIKAILILTLNRFGVYDA